MSISHVKKRAQKHTPQPRPTAYKLQHDAACNMLSVMDSIANADEKGNAFSCVIVSDAAYDKNKNDPAFATIVILPDEVRIMARPFNDKDKNPLFQRKDIDTHELEWLGTATGLDMASKNLKAGHKSALVISDCVSTNDMWNNSPGALRPARDIAVSIRHPSLSRDLSPTQKALHSTAHELCHTARKRGQTIDLCLKRDMLESIRSHPAPEKSWR